MSAMLDARAWRGGWRDGLSYGGLGFPLAFVELPLYVLLPNHYASRFGTPLAWLGVILLTARLLDALCDPLIGRWADALFAPTALAPGRHDRGTGTDLARGHDGAADGVHLLNAMAGSRGAGALGSRVAPRDMAAWRWLATSALALIVGFAALFYPPRPGALAVLAWCAAALVVTYLGFSSVSVIHQAWGARLAGDDVQRARIVAWREALGLAGVLTASVLFTAASPAWGIALFALLMAAGVMVLRVAPRRAPTSGRWAAEPSDSQAPAERISSSTSSTSMPSSSSSSSSTSTSTSTATSTATTTATAWAPPSMRLPWRNAAFRRLLAIYALNGIASAVPATLVLFFIQDRLQAAAQTSLFLGAYFAAAALAIPLWVRVVGRFGLARTWLAAMLLATLAFSSATWLGSGDVVGFAVVCVASGVALGADLTLPSAMLTGVIQRAGDGGKAEGAYMGWWSFVTKLNLALAAGIALPLLEWLGYTSGTRAEPALHVLSAAYCGLPCVLKLMAAAALYLAWIRPDQRTASATFHAVKPAILRRT